MRDLNEILEDLIAHCHENSTIKDLQIKLVIPKEVIEQYKLTFRFIGKQSSSIYSKVYSQSNGIVLLYSDEENEVVKKS